MNGLCRLIIAMLALLSFVGCNANGPSEAQQIDSLNQIPVPLNLVVYEGAEEIPLDILMLASKQAFETQPGELETQYYWMPKTVTWEQVTQFYEDAFVDSGWRADGATFNTIRWIDGQEQKTFVVTAVPTLPDEGYILVLMFVSR